MSAAVYPNPVHCTHGPHAHQWKLQLSKSNPPKPPLVQPPDPVLVRASVCSRLVWSIWHLMTLFLMTEKHLKAYWFPTISLFLIQDIWIYENLRVNNKHVIKIVFILGAIEKRRPSREGKRMHTHILYLLFSMFFLCQVITFSMFIPILSTFWHFWSTP